MIVRELITNCTKTRLQFIERYMYLLANFFQQIFHTLSGEIVKSQPLLSFVMTYYQSLFPDFLTVFQSNDIFCANTAVF